MAFTKTDENEQTDVQDASSTVANDNHETCLIAGLAENHVGLDPESSNSTKQDADDQRTVRSCNQQSRVQARRAEIVLHITSDVAVAALKKMMLGATSAELVSLRKTLVLIRKGSGIRLVIDDVELPKRGRLATEVLPRWATSRSSVPRKSARR